MLTTFDVTSNDLNTDLPLASRPVNARFGGGLSCAAAPCGNALKAPPPATADSAASA